MRIQYKHPQLYAFLIAFLYPPKVMRAFADQVGKGQTVFDIAAGYGRIVPYLHPSNRYYGIDLNPYFVSHGRRLGRDIEIKSIFDPASYKETDVFTIVDVVHHLKPRELKELFDLIFQHAKKKVVIIEPSFASISSRYGPLGKAFGLLFSLIDNDGINTIDHWFSEAEYQEMFQSRFGSAAGQSFALTCDKIGGHYLVTYTR
jgi:SAM-dependent methyltransferase